LSDGSLSTVLYKRDTRSRTNQRNKQPDRTTMSKTTLCRRVLALLLFLAVSLPPALALAADKRGQLLARRCDA
jgi:hypothetical protein